MNEFEKNYVSNEATFGDVEENEYDSAYLEEVYKKSKSAYSRFYNESKTNVLIYGSDHYAKASDNLKRTVERAFKTTLSEEERKKLTLNFVQVVIDRKVNKVVSMAPGCMATPYKSDDIHQVKDAKLSDSTLRSIKQANGWNEISSNAVYDYFIIGEVWANSYFDFDKGDIIGYDMKDLSGLPPEERYEMTPDGQFVEKQIEDPNKPIFSGEVCIELLNGYDVFIEEGVDRIQDSAFVGLEKLVHKNTLKYMIMSDPRIKDKKKFINLLKGADDNDEFSIFDRKKGISGDNKDLVLLKYFYFRVSPRFPNGKIFIKLKNEIIWSLDLQKDINGKPIFPISVRRCKRLPGNPRGFSPIRAGRSPQNEINRCVSKIAEHQVTLGDDKIVTAFSEGLSEGEKLLGIRHIKAGKGFETFKHIPGRTGEQYLPFLEFNVKHLFAVMEEDYTDVNEGGQSDIKATLYKNLRQKMKYVLHAKDIEEFFIEISHKALELAKSYYPDKKIIQSAGTCEAINIQEFKALGPMDYNIKIEPVSDDLESMFAKYLTLTEHLQYAAKELGPDKIGYVLKEFPFIDGDAIYGKTLIDSKEADNIILALDRGEMPPVSMYDNNEEIVKQLVIRRRKGDWKLKVEQDPEIEQRYQFQYEARQQILNDQLEKMREINAGGIPSDGPLVDVGYYVNEPKADGTGVKSVRAKIPVNAIKWTVEQLAKKNAYIEVIESMENNQVSIDAAGQQQIPII